MDLGGATLLVGGTIGLLLTLFGVKILRSGRVPAATGRAFRDVRDAGMYYLLFGVALVILAIGTSVPIGGILSTVSAVVAVVMVGFAVIRHRPRGRKTADRQLDKTADR
jgi:uncharacterized membrane protein YphA (DoxX/SURF4 family)